MGNRPWVVNASPLILLGKTRQLGLLSGLCESIAVPLAEPIIRRLRETGLYASDELVQRLLREVGE